MKKPILLSILVLLCFTNVNAQSLAIINDADGFVNVRSAESVASKIVGKLDTNAVFDVVEQENPISSNWAKVYFTVDARANITGYVHKSRIQLLSSLRKINNIRFYQNFCTANNDSVAVTINSAKFIRKEHILKYHNGSSNAGGSFWEKIDGKKIWGTDGELPGVAITNLSVKINGQALTIPRSAYNDLYEPRFKSLNVYLAENNTLYIQMDDSDGAGAYTVIWVIKNGKYYRRYVEDIC